ncbi:MAG TPA: DNA repair protein RecN [Blastocatellia bacterium]|nr:DNA repair protein RecN [Blastocatellia bacterium]HMX25890.1 DNA repair protein RecN [Blastocatellia bacterium]HMZ19004.1 DNA repair protein RecN [Blastocatellia bacterium]HNG28308.1 DNA repair protein RecN [Blastocatellia bacterium]
MLRFLNISNLALIDTLQIEFQPGLNVLSGETGSGKSIIIDSLGILLGERLSQEMIRSGETRAFVEGVFDCQNNTPLIELLSESGIEGAEEEIIIRREVSSNSRGRIFVNNQIATLSLLKAIQPHVLDIHGQGEQQSLLLPDTHLNVLDAFAGATARRQKTVQAYDRLSALVKELEANRQNESERLKALDMIEFQLSEIEQANLSDGEDVELESERMLLANAEKLASLCSEIYQSLYEDENSVLSRLAVAQRRLSDLADLDCKFGPYLEQLANAKYIFDDVSFFVGDYVDNIQASPERLQFVEDRLVEIQRLKRKYGGSVTEILAARDKLLEEKYALLHSEERHKEIESELNLALKTYEQEASAIKSLRRKAAPKLEQAVAQELADVAIGAGRFSVRFGAPATNQLAEKLFSLTGIKVDFISKLGGETAEFYFSANTGEELKTLKAVASGGELSRLMLVLKTVTAPTLFPRTLIFDEIDAGIGGRVAEAVGHRLKRLAKTNQVLCITHQSQIARYADAHFLVSKGVTGQRTVTKIEHLDNNGRIEELVRMIGGTSTAMAARKHAKELLQVQ